MRCLINQLRRVKLKPFYYTIFLKILTKLSLKILINLLIIYTSYKYQLCRFDRGMMRDMTNFLVRSVVTFPASPRTSECLNDYIKSYLLSIQVWTLYRHLLA